MTTTAEPASGTDPRTYALIVWILYLAGLLTAFVTTFVGFVIAVVKRPQLAGTPFGSHMTYAVRTFIGAVVMTICGTVLFFAGVLLGFAEAAVIVMTMGSGALLVLVFLWSLFRSIKGLILALDGRAIDNPEGWL